MMSERALTVSGVIRWTKLSRGMLYELMTKGRFLRERRAHAPHPEARARHARRRRPARRRIGRGTVLLMRFRAVPSLVVLAASCTGGNELVDSGVVDRGRVDSGVVDGGIMDSGVDEDVDSGTFDGGVVDSVTVDAGLSVGTCQTFYPRWRAFIDLPAVTACDDVGDCYVFGGEWNNCGNSEPLLGAVNVAFAGEVAAFQAAAEACYIGGLSDFAGMEPPTCDNGHCSAQQACGCLCGRDAGTTAGQADAGPDGGSGGDAGPFAGVDDDAGIDGGNAFDAGAQ